MKFATKPIQHCPLHFKYVATLPQGNYTISPYLLSQKVLFKQNLNVPIVY